MSIPQALFGMATSLLSMILIVAGVMKLFQIAGDLQEMKKILTELRRSAVDRPLAVSSPAASLPSSPASADLPHGGMTPEELVRSVHARNFSGDEFPL